MSASSIKIIFISLVLVGVAAGIYFFQKSSEAEKKTIAEIKHLQTFNQSLIPLYQEKVQLIQKFFPDAKAQGDMKPLLDLILKWDAKNITDVKDMVELSGVLDQRLATVMAGLDEKKKEVFLKELEKVEKKIRLLDPQFNPIQK